MAGVPCVELLAVGKQAPSLQDRNRDVGRLRTKYCQLTLLALPDKMKRVKDFTDVASVDTSKQPPIINLPVGDNSGLVFLLDQLTTKRRTWTSNNDVTITDFCADRMPGLLGEHGVDNPCAYPLRPTGGDKDSYFITEWDWEDATSGIEYTQLRQALRLTYSWPSKSVVMLAVTTPNRTVIWIPLLKGETIEGINANLSKCFVLLNPVYLDGPNIWIGSY